jgi:CubicO group peptidase (beta-lactamase class C family)
MADGFKRMPRRDFRVRLVVVVASFGVDGPLMRHTTIVLATVFTLLSSLSTLAQQSPPSPQASRDWEDFIDGSMGALQNAHDFAGAVVVIVRDGQVVFKKGYGYADFAERKRVDPERTLFRVASNTKMFTWTAVMQLVEKAKLDLHTDVNRYLNGMQIPPTFPEPITLEHLMTHTPGFEDEVYGLFSKTADRMHPLAELMRDQMPARIFAPGTVTAYSNYGTALAGLIVEQVSGVPYEKYLEDRILGPLKMAHATIRQPVPSNLAADLSKGYQRTGGRLLEQPFEYVPWAPAGGMSVSGEDMGRFMLAHLNDGALGDGRILRAETARAMRGKLTSFSPKINGMLHGFMESNWSGVTAYGHGGDTIWFHSQTTMLPAQNLGVFLAFNTDSGVQAREPFMQAFFDRYFPTPFPKEPAPPKNGARLERFSGTYTRSRVSESDLTRLAKLVGAVSIAVDDDGYLVMRNQGPPTRWRQVEPLVFAQVDGPRQLVFREDEKGEIAQFCTSPFCVVAMLRQPWWKGIIPQMVWLGVCAVVLVAALIGFPIAAILQRKVRTPTGSRLTRALAWTTSLTLAAGLIILSINFADTNQIVFGAPSQTIQVGLTLFVVGTILTGVLIAAMIVAWKQGWWRMAGRVCLTLVSVATLGTVAWLYQWNLIGFRF